MPESAARPSGTRPQGTQSEAEAGHKVREMFTQIAPRYDLLNHLLSLQLDRLWRARAARRLRPILQRPGALVLDLCCGTGDLALTFARVGKARIVGADFSHAMLVRAKQKVATLTGSNAKAKQVLRLAESDALLLPFPDSSFDLVATAFGFRNLANYEDGLKEIRRVLKPSGTLAILEFAEPPAGWFGGLYRWYFRKLLPRIGGLISGDYKAYTYLPASVSRFFLPNELSSLMSRAGYARVRHEMWTFATVALHTGVKSEDL
jgi:demethylmenaquinone methyltransferase / 2-methoxy-6-polyprenyl-1,4-benzoquinol methylase